MMYIYAALLLHSFGQKVDEDSVKKILVATGGNVDEARVRALVASLADVNIDEAIKMYSLAAQNPRFKNQWDQLYWKVIGLERHQQEKIAHVTPAISIARLTFVPFLLYFVMLLIHVGINPFAHPEPVLWVGLPLVVLGGFMIALASVRSHNRLWSMLFNNPEATATPVSRLLMTIGGWTLVLLPYSLLFISATVRLLDAIP